ncbi:SLC13 family permease [Nocardioides nematodiphilus]|uniref:SLC13 family permease n=1 Tax=Nocardioides nematodiphilus TaxID=2849669 RepID=UPI001CD9EE66|nr:SLC13 family permease [Nocardioides nematodiphilus]MCA1982922.1 arsenic transporter [Nocardioides nematodiphilus]
MIGVVCLLVLLVTAHRHPRPVTEAVVAVVVAATMLGAQAFGDGVPLRDAADAVEDLLPVVGFLVAILVVSEVCARAGLFEAAADLVRDHSRHDPHRLFLGVFVLAALVTTVLSLDATVVLLTPVVVRAAQGFGASGSPGAYACLRLANSGSLLLPVANLTNLLAMPYLHLTFGGFALRMALPLLVVLVVEYVGLRIIFRRDLVPDVGAAPVPAHAAGQAPPRGEWQVPAVVVLVMLVAFGVLSPLGVEPWVPAAGAAVLLLVWAAPRGVVGPTDALRAAHPSFALWVLALGVTVAGLADDFLGDLVARLLPGGTGFGSLLLIAVIATVAAALLANLSATLLIVPALVPLGDTAILAALLGLTIGAGLTWTGSLANLLWRRTLARAEIVPRNGRFHLVSLTLTPAALLAATAALALTS